MCTAIILNKKSGSHLSWLIGFNRDEQNTRIGVPPKQQQQVLAPLDVKTQGTWLGVNHQLLIIAILDGRNKTRGTQSRGRFVIDLLERYTTVREVLNHLQNISLDIYSSSTVFIADPNQGVVFYIPGAFKYYQIKQSALVITERGVDQKSARAKYIHNNFAVNHTIDTEHVKEMLTEHKSTRHPWYSTCCHGKSFGTLSSQIVSTNPRNGTVKFFHAEGRPCKSEYIEYQFSD